MAEETERSEALFPLLLAKVLARLALNGWRLQEYFDGLAILEDETGRLALTCLSSPAPPTA